MPLGPLLAPQIGAVLAPCEINTCPVVPALLFGIKAWLNCTFPTTSNFCEGEVVPIPTFPLLPKILIPVVADAQGAMTKFPEPRVPPEKITALSLAETILLYEPLPVVPGKFNIHLVPSVEYIPSLLVEVRIDNLFEGEVVPIPTFPDASSKIGATVHVAEVPSDLIM